MVDYYTIEELQHLRATGKALPAADRPAWLNNLSRTPTGLFPVPEESVTSSGPFDGNALAQGLSLLGGLLVLGFLFQSADFQGMPLEVKNYFYVGIAGVILLLITVVISANTSRHGKYEALEISQYPLSPGDGALLMIPHRKTQPPVSGAWLTLRERVKHDADYGDGWSATPLEIEELTLTKTGEGLYSTNILIPEDAVPSYEIDNYQLQWDIEVERRYSGGTTIRSFYLLWVRPAPTKTS